MGNNDPLGVLASKNSEQSKETARMENIHTGFCPICQTQMRVLKIKMDKHEVDTYTCIADRVAMPLQNGPILEGLY